MTILATYRRVVSLPPASGELEVTLATQSTLVPGDYELLLRVEAPPLNPVARIHVPLAPGNEGAGLVVAARGRRCQVKSERVPTARHWGGTSIE